MSKQLRAKRATPRAAAPVESGRKVWLAGLGALSVAQRQGKSTFDVLVAEGQRAEVQTEKAARRLRGEIGSVVAAGLQPIRKRVVAVRRSAEASFERGLGRVLSYAGIPSKADVDALIVRVDKLSRQLRTTR